MNATNMTCTSGFLGPIFWVGIFLAFTFIIVSPFKLSKMVSLRSPFASGRKQIEEATLEKLRRGESTRNVARDLHVSQSWVAQFRKQHLSELSDVNHSFGGRPQVYSVADRRACVRELTQSGWLRNYTQSWKLLERRASCWYER
jgi:hypothetical protein